MSEEYLDSIDSVVDSINEAISLLGLDKEDIDINEVALKYMDACNKVDYYTNLIKEIAGHLKGIIARFDSSVNEHLAFLNHIIEELDR